MEDEQREIAELVAQQMQKVASAAHVGPFFTKIYAPVLKAAGAYGTRWENGEPAERLSAEELHALARAVHLGLDLLLVAYAKAESMVENPERYGDLRTNWGMFLYNLMQQVPGRA